MDVNVLVRVTVHVPDMTLVTTDGLGAFFDPLPSSQVYNVKIQKG